MLSLWLNRTLVCMHCGHYKVRVQYLAAYHRVFRATGESCGTGRAMRLGWPSIGLISLAMVF